MSQYEEIMSLTAYWTSGESIIFATCSLLGHQYSMLDVISFTV